MFYLMYFLPALLVFIFSCVKTIIDYLLCLETISNPGSQGMDLDQHGEPYDGRIMG